MSAEIPFATIAEIRQRASRRPLHFFGRGNNAERTAGLVGIKPAVVLDNNPNVWGTTQMGVPVAGPDALASPDESKPYVVICSTSFGDISDQLSSLGFMPAEDYAVSPILENQRVVAALERLSTRIYLTSGLPPREGAGGGGIYEVAVEGSHEWRQVHRGNCHGLIRLGEGFVGIDDDLGIVEFGRDFSVLRHQPLPTGSRAHGVSYSEAARRFAVSCSFSDTVLLLDRDFRTVGEFSISQKRQRDGEPAHHINDVLAVGGSVYVSMFSLTGNWKRGIYDGGILEFDAETLQPVGPVASGLWMPHSIELVGDSMAVLDSLRGALLKNNLQEIGRFPGFMRGLSHDGRFFYVGQSRNRNLGYSVGLSNNISIDSGVVVFDEASKVSRTLYLPPAVSEIHAVVTAGD